MKQRLPKARTDELEDNAKLLRQWKAWHAEQLEAVLAGPDGAIIAPVVEHLKILGPSKVQTLIELVRAHDWSTVSVEAKFALLHAISAAIMRIRQKLRMERIDDPLPGEPRICSAPSRQFSNLRAERE